MSRTTYPSKAPAVKRKPCRRCGADVDTFVDELGLQRRLDTVPPAAGLDLAAATREHRVWQDRGPRVGWIPLYRPDDSQRELRLAHACKENDAMTTTTETAADPFADVLIPRDQYDRPFITPPDGGQAEPYTRVSTFCSALSDSSGIGKWKARHVALGVGRYADLAAMAAGLEYGRDNAQLDEIIDSAIDRVGCNAKANYGTAVHTFTEPERDAFDFVPENMKPDVEAYRELLAARGIEVVSSERFVVCDELKTAGTYDHIYRVPAELFPEGAREREHTGRRIHVVGDKKTGTLHMHEHALQLAVYAHSKHYDPATGKRDDLGVNLEWGLLVHIPAGKRKAEPYWINIAAGRKAAALALAVRDFRTRKDLAAPLVVDFAAAEKLAEPKAEKPAAKPTAEDAAAALAELVGVLDGTGAHAEHERKQVGKCVYCSCGARVQGRMETTSAHDKAVELVKGELNGRELTPEERLTEAIRVAVSVTALEALWRTRKAIWTKEHTALAAERRALIEAGKA